MPPPLLPTFMGIRLDEALVARGLAQSRSRARDMVLRGTVTVNGAAARKPSQTIVDHDVLVVQDEAQNYVARSALKLIHGLDHFKINVAGRRCLDIGASTGGFTQVLLERDAAHVMAIDVGHAQMAAVIAADPKVTSIEGLNARDITREHVSEDVSLIVCDVSFISLRIALPPALALAAAGTELLVLVKPQFEVGRENVGSGGIVSDVAAQANACQDVGAFITAAGWRVLGVAPSPLAGGDGNQEYLLAAQKG